MKNYTVPEIKINIFNVEDIITASGGPSATAVDKMEANMKKAGVATSKIMEWTQE